MRNILVAIAILISGLSFAQKKGTQEATIQTSAECNECKIRLEEVLTYTKGVKYAELDLNTMIITVGYSTKKISKDEIKKVISDTGYDADDLKANPIEYAKLPACCKVNGMKHIEH